MRRCTTEFVQMIRGEQGEPMGFLFEEASKREIYAVKRASKEQVAELFEIERPSDTVAPKP
jgi:hypothetical protein